MISYIDYDLAACKLTVFELTFHFSFSITCDWITVSHLQTQRIKKNIVLLKIDLKIIFLASITPKTFSIFLESLLHLEFSFALSEHTF